MGGPGSGRPYHLDARPTTSSYRQLDVRALHRAGLLSPGMQGASVWTHRGTTSRIRYTAEGDDDGRIVALHLDLDTGREMLVPITWTACNYGGERPWMLCPFCGRRVAILYGGRVFACRKCHGLAYPSTREDATDRQMRKARKIRRKLGGDENLTTLLPYIKPKGMHYRTFMRLRNEAREAEARTLLGMAEALTRILKR